MEFLLWKLRGRTGTGRSLSCEQDLGSWEKEEKKAREEEKEVEESGRG